MHDAREHLGRRGAARVAVALPVELENGKGVTRDVSASGVFLRMDTGVSLGAAISLSLRLEHADPRGPFVLRCQGRVVRVEPGDSAWGVAVAVARHTLEPAVEEPGSGGGVQAARAV